MTEIHSHACLGSDPRARIGGKKTLCGKIFHLCLKSVKIKRGKGQKGSMSGRSVDRGPGE